MRIGIARSFLAGGLLGGLGTWLLAGSRSDPERPPAPPPAPSESSPPPAPPHAHAPPAIPDTNAPDPGATLAALRSRVSALEGELAAARREARANLLKGALVLEVDGHLPEDLMKPLRDVEPTRGVVRLADRPELATQNPWMYLHTMVEEDFEEALQRALGHQLGWTEGLDLTPEERTSIRDYTERGFRLMVDLQRRAKTLRRQLEVGTGLTAEDRRVLQDKLNVAVRDMNVYVRACEPALRIPRLVPRKAEE